MVEVEAVGIGEEIPVFLHGGGYGYGVAEGVRQGLKVVDGMAANLYCQGFSEAGARLKAIYVEVVFAVFHMNEHRFQILKGNRNRFFNAIYFYIYSLFGGTEADYIPLAVVLKGSDDGMVVYEGLGIGGGSVAIGAMEKCWFFIE